MAADQQFCLRWNNHQSTLISVFDTLLESETLVDCTLAAEGQYLKAHKVVLSACSPYLEVLLSQHYEKHPIVILKDVKFQELKSMMDYMYRGEVNISQDQLGTFLKAAESLQIKGLSDGGGGENDSRDVGSTPTTPKRHDPPRKVPPSVPPVPQPRNPSLLPHSQSNSGLSIEPRRPVPQHISDSAPESPSHRSREGSVSPSLRKRRRIRRSSQGDDSNLDSHIDTSNSCDVPSQAQSTPLSTGIVPSIPASMTPLVPSSSTITKPPPIETEQNSQTETLNRLDNSNSLPAESGLIKEKIEPTNEVLLEPKTEYMDELNNEDSVEDLTLDDDDEMMEGMDMARPGPSHGGDGSNQGFAPWHMTGNQSGTDEVFMAAQEAVGGAHRDSQENGEAGETISDNLTEKTEIAKNKTEPVKTFQLRVLTPEELREQVPEKMKNLKTVSGKDKAVGSSSVLQKSKGSENSKSKTAASKNNAKSLHKTVAVKSFTPAQPVKILPQPSQQNISIAKSTFPFVIPSSTQPIFVSAEMIQVPSQLIPQTVMSQSILNKGQHVSMSQSILNKGQHVSEEQIQMPAQYITQTVVNQQRMLNPNPQITNNHMQISAQFIPQTVISQQVLKQNSAEQGHAQFIQQNVKSQQASDKSQQLQNIQNVNALNTTIKVSCANVVQKRFRNILPKP